MKPGPLAVAVVLVAVIARRWGRTSTESKVVGLLAAAGLAVYGSGLVHPPSLEHTILRAGEKLGPYTYALVGVMAFLETGAFVGLIAPGELTVVLGGVIAGQGRIDIVVLVGLVWACAVAGDSVSFFLGRRLGRGFLERHGRRMQITPERLETVERFLERHGGKSILLGRFVGLVRAVAPFIIGASRLSFRRFAPYDVVSAGLWSATFCLLGYFFWQSFDQVLQAAKQGALGLGIVIAAVVGGVAAYRYLREAENRKRARTWIDEQAERPLVRPAAAALRPLYRRVLAPVGRHTRRPGRFVWERLTPGGLGLELTTLLSIALVGGYVFAVLTARVTDHGPISVDARAFDIAGSLRAGEAVDAVKVLTALGALPAAIVAAAAAAVFLASRGERARTFALVSGLTLTVIATHVVKAAIDRPRPSGALVHTFLSSFPSGHAAYATTWTAVAVAVSPALRASRRAALVTGALVLTATIGLSRVYLRAHYLSDVIAGWALGLTLFALCGIVAMVVAYIRHNPRAA